MTAPNFEAIYAALFALAQNSITGIQTYERTLRMWTDVGAGEQPALFQIETEYDVTQGLGLPPRWVLHADWYLYCKGNKNDQPPSVQLNTLLTQIVGIIPPADFTQIQTLGGLVNRCYVNGKIETDEGVLGDQRIAIVPIEILIPS